MDISVIGLGKLGAPLAAIFASKGFRVVGTDASPAVVASINAGRSPVDEPGLQSLIDISQGRLVATNDTPAAVAQTDVTFIVVPTPSGSAGAEPGTAGRGTGMAKFTAFADTCVVGEDRKLVEPGSGVIGRLALTGHIPLGYHNDPERTAETFVEVDGRRHVITGDMATVEADGSIQLLGRGSQCINTGGEKVFPEEVESVLHGHPAVADVLVVGVPDERWGSVVTAVVAPVRRRDARARGAARALPRHPGRLQAAEAPRRRRPHQALAGRQGQLPLGRADRQDRNWRGWERIALVSAPISIWARG